MLLLSLYAPYLMLSPTLAKLNTELEEFFLTNNSFGNNILLAITKEQLRRCITLSGYEGEIESLVSIWKETPVENLCHNNNGLFVAALQVMTCYKGESDHDIDLEGTTLGRRFNVLLGCNNDATRNGYFEGRKKGLGQTDQDLIWWHIKEYFKKEWTVSIELPKPKTNSYRYFQYPISQVLFNRDELFMIAGIFSQKGLLPGEDVTDQELFELIISDWKHNKKLLTHRVRRVFESVLPDRKLEDQVVKRRLYQRQILRFYDEWDGSLMKKSASIGYHDTNGEQLKPSIYLERRINSNYRLHEYQRDGESRIIRLADYIPESFNEAPFFFVQDRGNTLMFALKTRSISPLDKVIMVWRASNYVPKKLEKKLIERGFTVVDADPPKIGAKQFYRKSICACFLPTIVGCEDIFSNHITIRHPRRVLLNLGLSTGYHDYLKGAGPEIIPDSEYNSKSYVLRIGTTEVREYDPFEAAAGTYQVTEEERTQRFRIVEYNPRIIEPQEKYEPFFPERQGLFSTANYTPPVSTSSGLNPNRVRRWVDHIISIEQT